MPQVPSDSPATSATPGAAAPASPPDWSAVADDVRCPMCEYNLRGLVEPRCPECGYRFDWPDILDPRRRLHPYLFEHHPERNVWSFWRTAVGGWRSARFWGSLQPVQVSRPGRLLLYWCLTIVIYELSLMAPVLATAVVVARQNRAPQAQMKTRLTNPLTARDRADATRAVQSFGSIEACCRKVFPTSIWSITWRWFPFKPRSSLRLWMLPVVPVVWSWLSFAILMSFRLSIRQARVRPTHVLRCVLYSTNLPFWFALFILVCSVAQLALNLYGFPARVYDLYLQACYLPGLVLFYALIIFWRLRQALDLYLRFPRPDAVAAAAQGFLTLIFVAILRAAGVPLWPFGWTGGNV